LEKVINDENPDGKEDSEISKAQAVHSGLSRKKPREKQNPLIKGESPRQQFNHNVFSSSSLIALAQYHPSSSPTQQMSLEEATEMILQGFKQGFESFENLLQSGNVKPKTLPPSEVVRMAMKELNKDQYKVLMESSSRRQKIFSALQVEQNAQSIFHCPEEQRVTFLEELSKE
jgi:hypothetical protein